MSVSEMMRDPNRAAIIVRAIGRNSFPSIPSSVRTGRKTIMMINSPNRVGRRTSTAASRMVSSHGLRGACAACRAQFSTMITELSTIKPKSIAPRLSRLAAMPDCSMTLPANSMASGIAVATIRPARRLPRNANSTATTSRAPASRLCFTVRITLSTSSVRSYMTSSCTSAGRVFATSASCRFKATVTR